MAVNYLSVNRLRSYLQALRLLCLSSSSYTVLLFMGFYFEVVTPYHFIPCSCCYCPVRTQIRSETPEKETENSRGHGSETHWKHQLLNKLCFYWLRVKMFQSNYCALLTHLGGGEKKKKKQKSQIQDWTLFSYFAVVNLQTVCKSMYPCDVTHPQI